MFQPFQTATHHWWWNNGVRSSAKDFFPRRPFLLVLGDRVKIDLQFCFLHHHAAFICISKHAYIVLAWWVWTGG